MQNQSRGKYCRRRVPQKKATVPDDIGCSTLATTSALDECRIINLNNLQHFIGEISSHSSNCEDEIILVGESRDGLASKWWWDLAKKACSEAAAEEKKIAIERDSFHGGVPAITVIVDVGGPKDHTSIHTMLNLV